MCIYYMHIQSLFTPILHAYMQLLVAYIEYICPFSTFGPLLLAFQVNGVYLPLSSQLGHYGAFRRTTSPLLSFRDTLRINDHALKRQIVYIRRDQVARRPTCRPTLRPTSTSSTDLCHCYGLFRCFRPIFPRQLIQHISPLRVTTFSVTQVRIVKSIKRK